MKTVHEFSPYRLLNFNGLQTVEGLYIYGSLHEFKLPFTMTKVHCFVVWSPAELIQIWLKINQQIARNHWVEISQRYQL